MNGAPIATPLLGSRSCRCSRPSATCSSGASESSPAIGSASSPRHAVARHDEPAAERLRALRAQRHVAVVDAHHDEVVRVVGDRRRERPRAQPESAHEPEADAAGAVVALDHGDLRQVALRVGDVADDPGAGDQLARARSRSRARAPARRDAERDRDGAHRVAQLRRRRAGYAGSRPSLKHPRHPERLEVVEQREVRDVARARSPRGRAARGRARRAARPSPARPRPRHPRPPRSGTSGRCGPRGRGSRARGRRCRTRSSRARARAPSQQRAQVAGVGGLADQHPHPARGASRAPPRR